MTTEHQTAFRAYAQGGFSAYGDSPKQAATRFFEAYPNKRKCNVIQGYVDGNAFIVAYSATKWPQSYRDVTKHSAANLPNSNALQSTENQQ